MSGLVQSPAHASSAPNGLYSCTTGVISESYDEPRYQIANHLVGGGGSCAGAVVIPIGVTAIGPNAFSGSSLTSITIPATVTHILAGAFYQATQLTSITIPASVTTIGDAAFRGATQLTSVTIPASVTSIGAAAFAETIALTSVTIPASVTSIGNNAFGGATQLTSITIPASVTSIGNYAFYGATRLATVTFAAGSKIDIGMQAFYGTAVTSITIPASFERIEEYAFYGATRLATVTFAPGSQLTSIGEYAFSGTAVTSITIPASVTSLDQNAFRSAALLTTVAFAPGSQLTSVDQYAFYGTALTNFTIPASVTSINTYAFYGASLLSDITVDGANLNYSSVDGVLFNKNSDTLIINLKGRSGTSYTIPATVTSIGYGAFDETALTSVTFAEGSQLASIGDWSFYGAAFTSITIPASVTSIGEGAFYDASVLTDVYFLGNAPDIAADADAFYGVATGARALVRSAATGFGAVGGTWNNLTVQTGVYLVTYNTFGGSPVTAQGYVANIATPTSPTRNGDTFAGWSLTDGGSVITFPYTPASAGDITLYARWTVAPTTPTTPTTVAPTTPTTVAPTTPTTFAPPAESVVVALPLANLPLVADNSLAPGGEVSVTFSGFVPGEFVQLIVASTPQVIGSGYANAQGIVTLTGNIPIGLAAGNHTLAVYAPVSGIGFKQPISVEALTLPATGSLLRLWPIMMMLFGGAALIVGSRRRISQT